LQARLFAKKMVIDYIQWHNGAGVGDRGGVIEEHFAALDAMAGYRWRLNQKP
jgi:hypothetical protein